MPDIRIEIKNIAQIKAAFGKSPLLMIKELNNAIRRSVIEISGDSRRGTPVDTGRLRASTYTKFSNLQGEVGTDTEYDIFVHSGTRYMRARPYLFNAVKSKENIVQENFKKAVQNVLDDIGRNT